MTRIAFFSDDLSGSHCARMTAHALSLLNGREGPPSLHDDGPVPSGSPVGRSGDGLPRAPVWGMGGPSGSEAAMCWESREGGDLVMSLPLADVGNEALRRRFDVAVAVGDGKGPAARALRAARYDSSQPGRPGPAPVWFLARTDQSVLMTKAHLSASHGPRLPYGTRALPMMLPRIGPEAAQRLIAGEPDEEVLANATLLAALLLAIGANPAVPRLDASELASMMAARELPRERALADRLVGLAAAYERLAGYGGAVSRCPPDVRPRDRRPIAGSTANRIPPTRMDRLSRWG